jgi:hypothetical protein
MPMRQATVDRYLRTIEVVVRSPRVRHFRVGYTCRPLKKRLDQYFEKTPGRGWNHGVGIADRLSWKEALALESRLFQEICKNEDRPEILYQKYDPACRDLDYVPSSGGRGDDGCDTHTVYIAWTEYAGHHKRP